jgi:hypothetical protein
MGALILENLALGSPVYGSLHLHPQMCHLQGEEIGPGRAVQVHHASGIRPARKKALQVQALQY